LASKLKPYGGAGAASKLKSENQRSKVKFRTQNKKK